MYKTVQSNLAQTVSTARCFDGIMVWVIIAITDFRALQPDKFPLTETFLVCN